MSKKYAYNKVADVFLNADRCAHLSAFATSQVGQRVVVVSTPGHGCSTFRDYYNGLTIALGKDFYRAIHSLPHTLDAVDLKAVYKDMAYEYLGVYYHEFFHLLYTDIDYATRQIYNLDRDIQGYVHDILNVLEDVTIEYSGSVSYPSSKLYVDKLSTIHFQEKAVEYMNDLLNSEPESINTFISFLLFYARGYDVSKFPRYELFENNKDFIKWGMFKCINTTVSKLRHNRQIAFAINICKLLAGEEVNKKDIDEGNIDTGSHPKVPGGTSSGAGKLKSILTPTNSTETESHYNNMKTTPIESEEIPEHDEYKEYKATRGNGMELPTSTTITDLTTEGIKSIANDDPVTQYTHIVERLDRYVDTRVNKPTYMDVRNKHKSIIDSVTSTIRKMRSHYGRITSNGQTSGTLHVPSYLNKKGTNKVFTKKTVPAAEADLVVAILVDNSGSMSGRKSKLAGEACISFSEALNSLNIPFAVYGFTEGRSCITIVLKDYHDLFEKTKYNLTLFTDNIQNRECYTFGGNIDEVNLRYVRDQLKKQPQADKVCIVISDGATCGDWKDLSNVASGMQKEGISVLGIGIYDDNVSKIYKNHIILRTQQDLEGLPAFLNKYLVKQLYK